MKAGRYGCGLLLATLKRMLKWSRAHGLSGPASVSVDDAVAFAPVLPQEAAGNHRMDLPGRGRARLPTMTMRQRLREGLAPLHERLDARIPEVFLSPRGDLRRLPAGHSRALLPVCAGS